MSNLLKDKFPELLKEWDYNKNIIKPDEITYSSTKNVWWKCKLGHEWKSTINNRTSGKNCPYCSNKKILKGYNDLLSNFPDICKEGNITGWWDYEKNFNEYGLKPDEVAPGSGKRVYWKCNKDHSWQTPIINRTGRDKSGCPYCSNQKVLKDYNDLLFKRPDLCKKGNISGWWDYDKNLKELNLKPDEVLSNCKKYVWWKCPKGHSWNESINNKNNSKTGCPYCSGHRVLKGFNDLQSKFPDLCKEGNNNGRWDIEKNLKEFNLKPDEVTSKSSKKVYWKCNKGHSWLIPVYSKTNTNSACPYCIHRKLLKGFNDFQTLYPELAKEWNYELNKNKPDEYIAGSNKKVWWKCSKGHEWETTINHRVMGRNCSKCNNNKTSFGEQCIYYYLLPYNAKNRFKLDNIEIDIYLPDQEIGIEFNGLYWHKNKKEKDLIKELKLSHKVTMYYICESDKNEIKENKIFFNKEKYNLNLEWALKELFNILNLDIDIDILRDKQLIYKNSVKEEKEKSLAFRFPHITKEWNYKKNMIFPEQIASGSGKKVWWICSEGHEWEAAVYSRTGPSKTGCPKCNQLKRSKVKN